MKKRSAQKELNSHVVVVRFSPSVIARLDALAVEEGLSRSAIVRRAVVQRYPPVPSPVKKGKAA